MSNIADCKLSALETILGLDGQVNDLYLKYLQGEGATAENISDAQKEFLTLTGANADQVNQAFQEFLKGINAPFESLTENLKWFWCEMGGVVPVNGVTAKSVIFDFADDWGGTTSMGVRSIEFSFEGRVLPLGAADFTAYATSANTFYPPSNAFDTSLSKIGSIADTVWQTSSNQVTNQRLIIVFNSEQTFDEIIENNYHNSGGLTDRGGKNTKITSSTDSITDTTYNAAIANSTVLNDTVWPEHVAANVVDDQTVWTT